MVNDVDIQQDEDEIQVIGREAEKRAASQSLMKKVQPTDSPTKKSSHSDAHNFENDVEKCPYPLDIIVQKINTVVYKSSDSSDEDDYNTTKEINHALQLQGFRVVEKENGADCEMVTFDSNSDRYDEEDPLKPSSSKTQVVTARRGEQTKAEELSESNGKFKKGHRRAYSMPNAHRDKAVLVVTDDTVRQEGPKKRHVVRYRLHPYKPSPKADAAVNSFIEQTNFEFPFDLDDNADDLEIDLDEEEICFPGDPIDIKESRIVLRKDNEFLRTGHRPPMASFGSCFKSIFSLHTETGNIWTHMYGCVAFLGMGAWFIAQPPNVMTWMDKLVFFSFSWEQSAAWACPSASTLYNVTLKGWEGCSANWTIRSYCLLAMGLSGCIPALHLMITDGFDWMIQNAAFHWLLLMAALYIIGAATYAFRFPERFFPGKFDLFCQSHQLFHMFVIVAAYVHFYGITEMAMKRLQGGSCHEQLMARYGNDDYTDILDQYFRPY
uniref:Adiponectin receptor n=1 Tax=Ditylenchus dipsaci TaxID=166011 RepID=A0A915ECG7_9BILA